MKNLLSLKIPVLYFLFLTCIAVVSTFLMTVSYYHLKDLFQSQEVYVPKREIAYKEPACDYNIKRLDGYSHIKPLHYVDKSCESGQFIPIKAKITELLNDYRQEGTISSASVYVRDFNAGDFMAINEDAKYSSGALMNIPLLITYLHLDEDNEGYLTKELSLQLNYININSANWKGNKIEIGKKYTIKQLLEAMMIYGDYNASSLLFENVDKKAFYKTFTDVGLSVPEKITQECSISAAGISLFMRTLYNATYLTINNSEYATKLLCDSEYKNESRVIGLPTTVRMAMGYGITNNLKDKELHESAIIYVNNCPYIITVMTKGKDIKQLSKIINQISATVYKQIVGKSISLNIPLL